MSIPIINLRSDMSDSIPIWVTFNRSIHLILTRNQTTRRLAFCIAAASDRDRLVHRAVAAAAILSTVGLREKKFLPILVGCNL